MRYYAAAPAEATPDFQSWWEGTNEKLVELGSRLSDKVTEDATDQSGSPAGTPVEKLGDGLADNLTEDATDQSGSPAGARVKKPAREEWLVKAMLLVKKHPNWSDAAVAREVGVHPGTLSRAEEYKKMAQMQRNERSVRRGHVECGRDQGTKRDVEAYDQTGDPAEMDWDD
jgi:hypothetical protein